MKVVYNEPKEVYKMTKRLQNFLPVFILLFGLFVLGSMFFDVLQNNNGDAIMTGTTATFGGTPYQFGTFFNHSVHFSYLNLLAFSFPAVIATISMVTVINEKKTSSSKFVLGIILTLTFILSVVLIFQLPENTLNTTTIGSTEVHGNYGSYNLAIGAVMAYIFAILGAIFSLLYAILQFEK